MISSLNIIMYNYTRRLMNDILTEFNGKIVGKRGMKQKNVMCYLKNNNKNQAGSLINDPNVIYIQLIVRFDEPPSSTANKCTHKDSDRNNK